MKIFEIIEGYKMTWSRGKKGIVRKYRCTDGPKKGRVVAKPSTCTSPLSQKKSYNLKKTRRSKGNIQNVKRSIRLKHATSQRLTKLNKSLRPRSKKRRR